MSANDVKDFPHPLNTWVEEEVDVPSFEPKVNESENRVEFEQTTKKATRRTFYAHSAPRKVMCASHEYLPCKGDYKYHCIHCDWIKVGYPVTYKYDPETKKLLHRETGLPA